MTEIDLNLCNDEDDESEGFLLNLSNTFKSIVIEKDNKINEIKNNVIDERIKVMSLYIRLNELSKNVNCMTDFLTVEDIGARLKKLDLDFRELLIKFIICDLDLIID
jgi:hypothetical protein